MTGRFRSPPIASASVLAGRVTADAVRNLFVAGLIIAVGSAIGFRFRAGPAAALGAVTLAAGDDQPLTFLYGGRPTVWCTGDEGEGQRRCGSRFWRFRAARTPPVAVGRITAALAGRPASVELVEVTGEAEAARLGMTGSPAILLDGVDPFAGAGAVPGVSCRIYRGPDGTPAGAPGVRDLTARAVSCGLARRGRGRGLRGGRARSGRPGRRGRRAPAAGGLRAVHQAVLRHFTATGSAPEPAALDPAAGRYGRTGGEVLAELDREDFVTLGADGTIRAAYPFSAAQTPHRVRITGGAEVWSMCAIDALGIPAMLGRGVVITSADPVTGEPVTVTAGPDRTTIWQPAGTVVYLGSRGCRGPAATVCCDALNFFTSTASARTWAGEHPDVTGKVVGQSRAEEIARQIFGAPLADD